MTDYGADDEILAIFREEAAEHLQEAGDCLLRLERQHDAEDVNSLFRSLHTIKGNASMLGFDDIASLSHACEGLMAKVRSGTLGISKQLVDVLLQSLDTIKALLYQGTVDGLETLLSGIEAISTEALRPVSQMVVPQANPAVSEPRAMERGNLQILVVEDDFVTRRTIVHLLRDYGACDIAIDGEEALRGYAQSLLEKPYDIVFLDVMMPKLDGFETARGIRNLEMQDATRRMESVGGATLPAAVNARQGTVIVMMSSLDEPKNYLKACYQCGADTYLVKPVDAEKLAGIFSRYMWRRSVAN